MLFSCATSLWFTTFDIITFNLVAWWLLDSAKVTRASKWVDIPQSIFCCNFLSFATTSPQSSRPNHLYQEAHRRRRRLIKETAGKAAANNQAALAHAKTQAHVSPLPHGYAVTARNKLEF